MKKPNYKLTPEQKEKLAGLRAEAKELVRNTPKPVVCVTPSSDYFSSPNVSTISFVYSRSRQKKPTDARSPTELFLILDHS